MLENERLPRKKRELSRFMCQEMLYEYMIQSLDEERYRAVEQFLSYAPDLQGELKVMHVASDYAAHLSQTRISAAHLDELKHVKSVTALVLERFRWVNWPDALKWASQAFAISFVLAMVALVIPWSHIDLHMPKTSAVKVNAETDAQVGAENLANALKPKKIFGPPREAATNLPKTIGTDEVSMVAEKTEVAKPAEKVPEKTLTPVNPVVIAAQKPVEQSKTVQLKGMLFRLMMTIDNAEGLTPEIKAKIEKLGAEKAGQVELGWRKTNPNGNYFHFKMPEINYNELIKTLGGYGPVRIYKNPHERVMPPGEIRIILFIEDKNS